MMPLHATPSAYQRAYPAYDATPKAVIAAVAYGLALRLCEDDPKAATALLRAEWAILHQQGIVPQPPRQPLRGREASRSTTRRQHLIQEHAP